MRMRLLLPAIAALGLTACGEDQTAQRAEPPAPSATQPATPPPATPPPAARAPATPPPAAQAPARPGAGDTAGAGTTAPGTADPAARAATPPANLQPFQGRTYSAGPMTLRLNADSTFVMTEVEGNRRVQGRYAYQDGVLTLSDPQGDTGPAQFPIRCRFESTGTGFRLAETGGSCERFKDVTFQPAAG